MQACGASRPGPRSLAGLTNALSLAILCTPYPKHGRPSAVSVQHDSSPDSQAGTLSALHRLRDHAHQHALPDRQDIILHAGFANLDPKDLDSVFLPGASHTLDDCFILASRIKLVHTQFLDTAARLALSAPQALLKLGRAGQVGAGVAEDDGLKGRVRVGRVRHVWKGL